MRSATVVRAVFQVSQSLPFRMVHMVSTVIGKPCEGPCVPGGTNRTLLVGGGGQADIHRDVLAHSGSAAWSFNILRHYHPHVMDFFRNLLHQLVHNPLMAFLFLGTFVFMYNTTIKPDFSLC